MVEWLQSPACHVGGTGSNPVGTANPIRISRERLDYADTNFPSGGAYWRYDKDPIII